MKAAIFTLDTESYKARKASAAGMVLKKLLEQSGFETAAVRVIPKDRKVAASVLKRVAQEQTAELVFTTGANGPMASDCAPYALMDVAERLFPGIPETIRAFRNRDSLQAVLDCSAAGICNKTLMVNLPEDAKEAKEVLEFLLPELKRAVEMLCV